MTPKQDSSINPSPNGQKSHERAISWLLAPIVQYGFAGMCAVLLGIICWRMNQFDTVFDKALQTQAATNLVIQDNSAAIRELRLIIMTLSRFDPTVYPVPPKKVPAESG